MQPNQESKSAMRILVVEDNEEVRRAYLHSGGDAAAAGRIVGAKRQTVNYHLRWAREETPLVLDELGVTMRQPCSAEDRAAVTAFLYACAMRAGILIGDGG